MLRLGAEAWELIFIERINVRVSPIFAQIDLNNICILGGHDGSYHKDGVVLDA